MMTFAALQNRRPAAKSKRPLHALNGAETCACRPRRAGVQAKLRVGGEHDPLEAEADRAAERVLLGYPVGPLGRTSDHTQRKCAACEAEEEEQLHLKPRAGRPRTTGAEGAAAAVARGGRPLPRSARTFFEPRFGRDFSQVRIHDDSSAQAAAEAINARAFTLGRHIAFAAGHFSPESLEGRRLLAHELAHVVQQDSAPAPLTIRKKDGPRQARPTPAGRRMPSGPVQAPATDAERRELVEATIDFFEMSADFYGEPRVQVDAALFDRLLTNWYTMVVRQEEMIDQHLSGDADLKRRLHAAYSGAMAVLVPKFAASSGQSVADIYQTNSGRIPMWAWPDPHHLAAGISTPLSSAQAVDPLTGQASSAVNGVNVKILPDAIDASLGTHAKTRSNLQWTTSPGYQTRRGRVIGISPLTTPVVTIQTFYGNQVTESSTSGYGRGTTPEDLAGARVTPRSSSLGHHEGSHGLAVQRFIAEHPVPTFTATASPDAPITMAAFHAAVAAYNQAMCAWQRQMDEYSFQTVDCAGTPKSGTQTVNRGAPCNDSYTMRC